METLTFIKKVFGWRAEADINAEDLGIWAGVLGTPAQADGESDRAFRQRLVDRLRNEEEEHNIRLENRIRLQQAAVVLRDVLPGYGIDETELHLITRPLAEKIQQLLEAEAGE